MNEATSRAWRPTRTNLISGAIVIAGFGLTGVSWWFFLLVGAGALGPGILRELGVLHDKDEFQRQADYRAGYHAFLVLGVLCFVMVAFFRSGERAIEHTERLPTLFLAVLWFTWLLGSLIAYWGPVRAAAWILRIFGAVVLVFTIVSNLGPEWTGWAALLLHPLLSAPFFLLAWLAGRRPRLSGVLLLVTAVLLFVLLAVPTRGNLALITRLVTFVFVLGPLLAAGVTLLVAGGPHDDLEEAAETQL